MYPKAFAIPMTRYRRDVRASALLTGSAIAAALLLLPSPLPAQEQSTQTTAQEQSSPQDQAPPTTGSQTMPGSDLWAEARLITTYSINEHLNPFDIGVDASDGTVTLTGTVDNEAQRSLAEQLARDLSGIDQVDNRLEVVDGGTGQSGAENPFYRLVNQANTTTRIKLRLLWSETTNGLLIDVDTDGEHVTLTGKVRTEEEKALAERIAGRTEGVGSVDNQIVVDPDASFAKQAGAMVTEAGETISDAWITTRVAASLRFDSTINHGLIDVQTNDGVVTLKGQVPTLAQKQNAEEIAAGINGVERVDNQLEITAPV
jgi:osmotically-inducible protein OsmY